MKRIARTLGMMAALAVSACASLTAEAPLFTAADAADPAPLMEGVWVEVNEDCPTATIHEPGPLPDVCASFELRRTADGWTIQTPAPSASRIWPGEEAIEVQGVIASAVERDLDGAYAPFYLLERVERDEDGVMIIRYDGIVPIGEMPAREAAVMFEVACGEVLADGPVEGVTEEFDETGEYMVCTAQNRRAAREAVRRAAIENLPYLQNHRLILRHPALTAELTPRS